MLANPPESSSSENKPTKPTLQQRRNVNAEVVPATTSKDVLLKDVDPDTLLSIVEKSKGLFPMLDNIRDMRQALKIVRNDLESQKQPFPYVEKQENGYSFFNYNFMTWFTFGDLSNKDATDEVSSIKRAAYLFARECRGVCYDLKTGLCASRGLQKFFNVEEKPETQISMIDFTQEHVILDKMDGTMVCSVASRNETLFPDQEHKRLIRFRTKMGWITDPSKYTEEYIYGTSDESKFPSIDMSNDEYRLSEEDAKKMENGQKGYIEFSTYWIKRGYSPIFEFVSPRNQIVLLYEKPSLVLLALRHNFDGHYISYEETRKSCEEFGIQFTEPLLQMKNETSLAHVQQFIKEQIGVEGYVVRFSNGNMYKIKSSWYMELHSCKTSNKKLSDTDVWIAVLDNTIDDIQSNLQTQEVKKELEDFVSNFWKAIVELTRIVETLGAELKEKYPARKDYFNQGCLPYQKENKFFCELLSTYYNISSENKSMQDEIVAIIAKRLKPTAESKKKMKNDVLSNIKESIEATTGCDLTVFKSSYLEEKKKYYENLRLRREQREPVPQIYED